MTSLFRKLYNAVAKIVTKENGSFGKTVISLLPFLVFVISASAWKLNSTLFEEMPLISVHRIAKLLNSL